MTENQTTWTSARAASRGFLLRWCAWYFLGASVLFGLIALRYLAVAPEQTSFLPIAFTVLMIVAQGTLLAFVGFVLVAPLALVLPRPRVVAIAIVFVAQVLLTFTFVDTFVYQQYRFHLDASVWNLATGGAAGETFVFAPRTYVKLAGAVALILLLSIAWARLSWNWTKRCTGTRRGLAFGAVLFGVLLTHNALFAWSDAAGYVPILRQSRVLPLHRPLTAKRALRWMGVHVARVEAAPGDAGSGIDYPREPLRFEPLAKKSNVLFLVVDSWRADALNESVAPNLTALAAESQQFTEHYSGGNATRIGMFTLFYGIPGTYWHDVLGERRGALIVREFLKQGYDVVAFRSAPLFSPEFDCTIYSDVKEIRLTSDGDSPADRDRDATEDFLKWLDTRDVSRPFFALVFYDAPHAYDFPKDWPLQFQPSLPVVDYMALDNDTDPEPFHNRYRNSVRYVDSLAGRVIGGLRAHGLMDDTVLLTTGDHGQEFNDLKQNYWGHNSNYGRFQTHVPMFVRWPGRAPERFAHRTSHFDVAPTVLRQVLGCVNPPEDYSVGKDLFDASDRGVLTLATYGEYGGLQPDGRCVLVTKSGEVDVVDREFKPATMTDADRHALQSTFKQRSWFRPRPAAQ